MIAKIKNGTSFRHCVKYLHKHEKKAKLLKAEGVLLKNLDTVIKDFIKQSGVNPRLSRPVGHISLNFSIQDKDKLTDLLMRKIALEYMEKMGIKDTQYIIVRHFDREHPHLHICFNRVNNNGITISDRNEKVRNKEITQELTKFYKLYFPKGKENVKIDRLREPDKTKYEIYDILKYFVPRCKNWDELKDAIHKKGIRTEYIYKGQTKDIQGIIFYKNNLKFTGSMIDRQFSYSKIDAQLKFNKNKIQVYSTKSENSSYKSSFGIDNVSIDKLFEPGYYAPPTPQEDEILKRKKNKKRKLRL